jgi:hypothetical protein
MEILSSLQLRIILKTIFCVKYEHISLNLAMYEKITKSGAEPDRLYFIKHNGTQSIQFSCRVIKKQLRRVIMFNTFCCRPDKILSSR